MNSLTILLTRVLEESGTHCSVSTTHDIKTVMSRVKNEGQSFLTITLPSYGKDLERALSLGVVDSSLFAPFKRKKGEALPVFLGGFLSLVFDKVTGRILDTVDCSESIDAIRAIRQITGLLGKVELECDPKRIDAALIRYIENDSYVRYMDKRVTPEMRANFLSMFHRLFGSAMSRVQRDIRADRITPVHGPGATADHHKGNLKWDPRKVAWPAKLEEIFPRWRYQYSSGSIYLDDVLAGVEGPDTEMPVKVITVPKTMKTPRIIAVEPTAMQYMQQGLMAAIYDAIDGTPIGRIMSWDSQRPNQLLAKSGSLPYGRSATLDLSDASDLVSNRLVEWMLRDWPAVRDAVQATRSETANVLDRTIVLSKFASMGSALCFPIESMVFTTIAFLGLREAYPTVHPDKLLKKFQGEVRVYGDDIIVPVRAAQSVVRLLEAYGLRVNRTKSFWTGMFRESCGKDYFAGVDVTYVKCRRELPSLQKARSEQVQEIVSAVELANALDSKGYGSTAEWIRSDVRVLLKGVLPYVYPDSPALGIVNEYMVDMSLPYPYHADHQVPMIKAWVVSGVSPSSRGSDAGNLMKVLSRRTGKPIPDPRHLERAGRPAALRIKLRSVPVF